MAVAENSPRRRALPAPSAAGSDGAILDVEVWRVVEELCETALPPSGGGERALACAAVAVGAPGCRQCFGEVAWSLVN